MTYQIDSWNGRVAIHSDNLAEDAALELVGDFGSDQAKMKFAEFVCNALNDLAAQQLAQAKRKRVAEMA